MNDQELVSERGSSAENQLSRGFLAVIAIVAVAYLINGVTHLFPELRPYTGFLTRPNERSLIELAEAGLWLFASISFFRLFLRERRLEGRNALTLLLLLMFGVLGFLVFGEEISWGQHFGLFEPPAEVKALNAQEEFNFHNLNIAQILNVSPDHFLYPQLSSVGNLVSPAFHAFSLFAWGLLPLFLRSAGRPEWLAAAYPIPKRRTSLFLTLSFVLFVVVDKLLYDVAEIMELCIAITMALVVTDLLARRSVAGLPDSR